MASSFIRTRVGKNGAVYAEIFRPMRRNGKKVNDPEYLGKAIDLDKGVFYSKKRGYFTYTLENGYGEWTPQAAPVGTPEEKLILEFGASYAILEFIKSLGYYEMLRNLAPRQPDSVLALIIFRIVRHGANTAAGAWLSGTYASLALPGAKLQSQRISELLVEMGQEDSQRKFFSQYLKVEIPDGRRVGILVDSTGLPNDIDTYLTMVSNHGGNVNNEMRLIFVADQATGKPLFFRYNTGNVVDVSTLKSTIMEMSLMGVDIGCAIVDAGYYSDSNVKSLFENGIPFLTRLKANKTIYKELVAKHATDVLGNEYVVKHDNRLVGVKRVEEKIEGHIGYAYVCVDQDRRYVETREYIRKAISEKNPAPRDEWDTALRYKGIFVLVSSEKIEPDNLLSLYYSRQQIEQIFDISKNYVELLPLRVHCEDAIRGHLMLVFAATVICQAMSRCFRKSKYSYDSALYYLENIRCKVYDDKVIIKEPNKQMKDVAKLLDINIPDELPTA
jgi:hypothetical protein